MCKTQPCGKTIYFAVPCATLRYLVHLAVRCVFSATPFGLHGPEVIKLDSCSTKLSMKFELLITENAEK